MNPATALAVVTVDELIRCGLAEAVIAPGSRSAPLALELYRRSAAGRPRLHVRVDERAAAFCALGLAKASRRPVAVVCTSGSAIAHLHAAVIEADESGVPLLLLTADRPPELRGTGANQTIDQLKLFGSAVRWFCELGVAEAGTAGNRYWRSALSRAWALASGAGGSVPGPVHLNVALREPLVPGTGDVLPDPGGGTWPDELAGRTGGRPWTGFGAGAAGPAGPAAAVDWTERGLLVCGDGDYEAGPLLDLAARAGWPVLAEPSSNARRGPNALSAYQYLLADPEFAAAHRPDLLITAGRPGLSRGQAALLRAGGRSRHVVVAQGAGRWADPGRSATDVVAAVALAGAGPAAAAASPWLRSWQRADAAAREAADAVLDAGAGLSEPRLARDLAAALPAGALLWVASSLPIRDLDSHLAPRDGPRILASRGASGIDGMISSAIGAALAHQAAGGGPAFALLGDLAVVHDAPGLLLGASEPRPDLCLVVVNNDGGGIFSTLEPAAIPEPFERVFGTPHGTSLEHLAAAAGLPWRRVAAAEELAAAISGPPGLRLIELVTSRPGQAELRATITRAALAAITAVR